MKKVVVVDIDGTITKVGDRLKYLKCKPKDWDSFYNNCFEDEPVKNICDLVCALSLDGYRIAFCTGRRGSCREQTLKWIDKYLKLEAPYFLLMREDGDHRHDTEVKPELLIRAGIDFHSIALVLEDRNSMVGKWRELGLTCLQVAEGDF